MTCSFSSHCAQDFARAEFGAAALGDARRTRRLVSIAEAMATSPGKSICQMLSGSYAMNAAYEFFKQDYAAPGPVQSAHRARTRERCQQPGRYLLLEDTSDISYSGREPVAGLGPAGDGMSSKSQCFKLHSVLAARIPDEGLVRKGPRHPTLDIRGLLHQAYTLRQPRETKHERQDRQDGEWLETDLWADAAQAIGAAPQDPAVEWIYVADRGADIFDHLVAVRQCGAKLIVRAKHDRRVHLGEPSPKATGKLFEQARSLPALGAFTLELRARPGRAARTATLHVSAMRVVVQGPQAPGHGKNGGPRQAINVVRVFEQPAGGKDALEWILLTDLPVDTFEQAFEVAGMYSCRWLVEEFHKALKSGMGAEKLQLEHGKRLMAAVAVMSIVALRLLDLRDKARLQPDEPAGQCGVDDVEIAILQAATGKPVTTIRQAVRAIARLGGFPGRKGDGEPGMMVLWRGMSQLLAMKAGWLLAQHQGPPRPRKQ